MKFCRFYIFFISLLFFKTTMASHISGGELFYNYIGPGEATNSDKYRITVRLFRECTSTGQILDTEFPDITIFVTGTSQYVTDLPLTMTWQGDPPMLQNTPGAIPCLTGDGNLCYQIGIFDSVIDLPRIPTGYTLTWVRCCRQQVTNVQNTPYPDSARGATFLTHIPGTNVMPLGHNSSPEFVVKDTALVCAGNPFTLYFNAIDPDADSLVYSFCDAYLGATPDNPNPFPNLTPPRFVSLPPGPVDTSLILTPLPYLAPYSGSSPLGDQVALNSQTGIISGIAPAQPGKYVVNVCVAEYRHGVLLNVHHKDFILTISDCSFASAKLNPSYLTCNGFGLQFENQSPSSAIYSYYWDFGVPGVTNDTSTSPQPFYNFPDSGTYAVKLIVNRGGSCGDSTITLAKIYPGFKVGFGYDIKCLPSATIFTDSSTTKYGLVSTWLWNFGDTSGTSTNQDPSYIYQTPGLRTVQLTVTNSKGCTDSITRKVYIPGKPIITLLAVDTAVCNLDTLTLSVSASPASTFSWAGGTIINAGSATPLVFPTVPTIYIVTAVDSFGCINTAADTVNINQLPIVASIPDTVICSGTSITLTTTGTGISYQWQPSIGLSPATGLSPVASPMVSTQYVVTAKNDQGCIKKDTVNVSVNISPTVSVSPDSLICNGGSAHITAVPSVMVTYSWSPTIGLDNPLIATPVASPTQTTKYQIEVTDSNTCTGTANVVITVIPKPQFGITPPDKNICRGDSVQVAASGGDVYQWFPATNIYSDTVASTTIFPTETTTYTVVITSNTCHISDSLQTVINVSQPFALDVTKSNDVDCFTGQATITAIGGNQYTWSPSATLSNPYASSTVATPVTTTTYYVTVSNGTVCVETDSIQVKIITDNMQNGYYLASAFTPNGDGYNDCFGVKQWGGIKSIQFSVYNRWGQRIFYSASPSGCWDGTFNGVQQAPGTYVYQVWANTVCGNVYRKGTVVLVR